MSEDAPETIDVLVVEDHQVLAEALTDALSSHPSIAVSGTAGTLAEAARMVEQHPPDVVLMDVRLPDGDGAAATADVLHRAPQAKVVILSAVTGIDVVARAVEAGAVGFVAKTEPLDALISAVCRVHDGEALFPAQTLTEVASHLRSERRRPGADLTPRELEVLSLMASGLPTDGISEQLVVSIHTVRNHVRNVLHKLDAHTKLEAVAIAVREQLVTISEPPR